MPIESNIIIPIIISLIAVLISFLIFLYTFLLPAKLNIIIGNSYALSAVVMNREKLLPAITLPLTISNEGARPGEVYLLGLKVIYPSGESDYFKSVREVESIAVMTSSDQEKIQENLKDVFFGIFLLGKNKSQNTVVFIPINQESFNFPERFEKAKIILYAQKSKNGEWERYDESNMEIDIGFSYKNKDQRIRETVETSQSYEKLNDK